MTARILTVPKALRDRLPAGVVVERRGRFPVAPAADRTVNGILFDSKTEAERYAELLVLERAGEISNLRRQVPFHVTIGGAPFCRFTVDFAFFDNRAGREVLEETKSTGTRRDAAYRLRRKAAELFHEVRITEFVAGQRGGARACGGNPKSSDRGRVVARATHNNVETSGK